MPHETERRLECPEGDQRRRGIAERRDQALSGAVGIQAAPERRAEAPGARGLGWEGQRVGAGEDPEARAPRVREVAGLAPEHRPPALVPEEEIAPIGFAHDGAEQPAPGEEPLARAPGNHADRAPLPRLAEHAADGGSIGHATPGAQHEYLEILSGRDLAESDFTGARLAQARLRATSLRRAVLFGCDLRTANLVGCDLFQADLRGACLRGSDLSDASLVEADIREGTLARYSDDGITRNVTYDRQQSELSCIIAQRSDLTGAKVDGAVLLKTDFTDAVLRNASFRSADMRGSVLRGAVLENCDLEGCNLTHSDLQGADLSGARLEGALLVDADLRGAVIDPDALSPSQRRAALLPHGNKDIIVRLPELLAAHERWVESSSREGKRADLSDLDLSTQELWRSNLSAAIMRRAVLRNCKLAGGKFPMADLSLCDLRGSDARRADMRGINLERAVIKDADMSGCDLSAVESVVGDKKKWAANLSFAKMSGTRLVGARLCDARLTGTDFTNCDLRNCDFRGSNIHEARIKGANLAGALTETPLKRIA